MSRFYFAEGRSERIKPGISSTVKVIWKIYIFLTIIGIFLYFIAGMNVFDSVNHALTTLATSGYSTKNASIASFDSVAIEFVAIILMLIGGISFVVHFKMLEGDRKELINNPEVRAFLIIIFAGTTLIFLNLFFEGYPIDRALRLAAFQAVSVGTTTGYSITSIDNFPDFSKVIFLFLMFTGACAGSTGGGFKVLRVIILIKLGYQEVMKSILPEKAVVPFKLRNKIIEDRDMIRLAGLFFLYLFAVFLSTMLFTLTGYKPIESLSLAFSSMFNIGPTLINPTEWFNMGSQSKIILIIGMWIGRLEIFPAFALISSLLIISRREKRSI
jgi:trk system potassium uptake protein TrkH